MADNEIAQGYAASEGAGGAGAVIFNNDDLLNLQQKNMEFAAQEQDKSIVLQQQHQKDIQKMAGALNPDLKGIFPGDTDAIKQMANGLTAVGVGYLSQKQNPHSQQDFLNKQTSLELAVNTSKQRNVLLAAAMKEADTNPDKYDLDASKKAMATLAAKPLSHLTGDDFGTPLLVAKPPDLIKTQIEAIKGLTDKPQDSLNQVKTADGRTWNVRTTGKDEKEVEAASLGVYDSNPQGVQKVFDNLDKADPSQTAGFKVAASLTGGIAAKNWFIDQGKKYGANQKVTYVDGSYGDPQRFEWQKYKDEKEKEIDPTIFKTANILLGRGDANDVVVHPADPLLPDNISNLITDPVKVNTYKAGSSLGVFQGDTPKVVEGKPVPNPNGLKDKEGNPTQFLTTPTTIDNIHMLFANFNGEQYAMNTQSLYNYAKKNGLDANDVISNAENYKSNMDAYQKVTGNYLLQFYNGLKGEEGVAQKKLFLSTVKKRDAFNPDGSIDLEKLAGVENKNNNTPKSQEDFNEAWGKLKSGEKLVGLDGNTYTKK